MGAKHNVMLFLISIATMSLSWQFATSQLYVSVSWTHSYYRYVVLQYLTSVITALLYIYVLFMDVHRLPSNVCICTCVSYTFLHSCYTTCTCAASQLFVMIKNSSSVDLSI